MDSDAAVRLLDALAQDHRLAVFRLLVQAGSDGLPAGAISARLGLAPSSLSFHLAQLAHAGLITQRRASRSIIYAADYAVMTGLMAYLTENCCGGVSCAPSADAARPDPCERSAA